MTGFTVNVSGISPNFVGVVILWRSFLLLMGKFGQF